MFQHRTKDQEMTTAYRKVFTSAEGRKVLDDILNDLGCFAIVSVDDPAKAALKNYALLLLYKTGILQVGQETLIDILLKVPVPDN